MPPPRGEGMTSSPLQGLPHPCAHALETRQASASPHPQPREGPLDTSFVLRHHQPAPNDGVDVKDLRPLTRSALPGRFWTPTPQPTLPKKGRERKKKDPLAGAGTDKSSPFRDDGAIRVETVELEGSVRMFNPNRGVARLR